MANLLENRNYSIETPPEPPDFPNLPHLEFSGPNITSYDVYNYYVKIISAFGDVVHQNDGAHLDEGIQYERDWKQHFQILTTIPS